MKKATLVLGLLILPLMGFSKKAEIYKEAIKECPAYNNMKHSQNTNSVKLNKGQKYRVIESRKGQILTIIKGEKIAQRWVDEECFSNHVSNKKVASKKAQQNILAISWQNSFCQLHQHKKECKTMQKGDFASSHFVLHGLWPQPYNNQYCNVSKKEVGMDKNKQWNRLSKLELTSEVRDELKKYMTGYSSNLHLHEWIKHGTCYGTDANRYYKDAIELLKQVNNSKVQKLFEKNIGKVIKLKEIRDVFDSEFGVGAGNSVVMNCQKGLITELWLYIGSGSDKLNTLLKRRTPKKSRCLRGKVDEVGFF
jgi:ribonuclease T2